MGELIEGVAVNKEAFLRGVSVEIKEEVYSTERIQKLSDTPNRIPL